MRRHYALALVMALSLLPGFYAAAQPAERVSLDVRALDIDNLLQFFSRTFELTVVKDPNLTGAVTIMCPRPVSRQEALDLLNSVLEVRGFTLVVRGALLKVVPISKAVQSNVGLTVGRTGDGNKDQVVTQMVTLRSADAGQLQSQLAPLVTAGASIIANSASNTLVITDYSSNIARLLQIIEQLDSADACQVRVFPLKYANASDVAQIVTQMFFSQPSQPSLPSTAPGWQRRLAGVVAATMASSRSTAGGAAGQIVADSRTNSVLVSAGKERLETIAQVVEGLDRPVDYKGNLTVISLKRANAQDVANSLNQALGISTGQARTTSQPTTSQLGSTRATSSSYLGGGLGGTSSPQSRLGSSPATGGGTQLSSTLAAPSSSAAAGRVSVLNTTGNVSVVAEPNTNSLIVTAPPEYAEFMRGLIAELDQTPPQVLIEAVIAEVTLDTERKLGLEFSWNSPSVLGQGGTGTLSTAFGLAAETGGGLTYSVMGKGLQTLLKALATDNKVSILSTPRIFTSNNRAAEINISTQTPYVSTVSTSEINTVFGVQYLDVGVILQVTPQISPDGTVTLQVDQEANELLGYQQFGSNVSAPTVARRSAQATIQVADGQTVILGGIIRDTTTRQKKKVPVLGDLPLLGSLFRHTTSTKHKSELIVLLTPRVVRSAAEASALTQREKEKSLTPLPANGPKR